MGGVPYHFGRGGTDFCMLERSVLVEPMEEKVWFVGVPSSSYFVREFDASVQ